MSFLVLTVQDIKTRGNWLLSSLDVNKLVYINHEYLNLRLWESVYLSNLTNISFEGNIQTLNPTSCTWPMDVLYLFVYAYLIIGPVKNYKTFKILSLKQQQW